MIWKTRNCRGKGSGHPWVSLLLFAIWWEITFCSTLAKQNSDGGRPPKPNRGCKFRASIEHKLTRGLSQKTVCVYAICSALSGLSSQFCYNVTKCWSGCRKTNRFALMWELEGAKNWTFHIHCYEEQMLWLIIWSRFLYGETGVDIKIHISIFVQKAYRVLWIATLTS